VLPCLPRICPDYIVLRHRQRLGLPGVRYLTGPSGFWYTVRLTTSLKIVFYPVYPVFILTPLQLFYNRAFSNIKQNSIRQRRFFEYKMHRNRFLFGRGSGLGPAGELRRSPRHPSRRWSGKLPFPFSFLILGCYIWYSETLDVVPFSVVHKIFGAMSAWRTVGRCINEITLHRAQLVLGWVTVFR